MKEKKNEEEFDIKGTLKSFIQEELPELSQEDAIKFYKENNKPIKKKKSGSSEDDDTEDDEYLKKLKRELLEALERVNALEKKIFEEKTKQSIKNLKVKEKNLKTKDRQKVIDQMREKVQQEQERSRE